MATWILTVGNSDVFLTSSTSWNSLERQAKPQNRELPHFTGTSVLTTGGGKLFSFPARALGLVYASHLEQHGSTLRFPRLEALFQQSKFSQQLPKRVIVLLTDQAHLFDPGNRKQNSPYWQDTCELEPILRFYLEQKLPKAIQTYLMVQPEAQMQGLDHWDNTLSLIQKLLAEIECRPRETIYVSHQAGTPALSSALQFVALTQFGEQVEFLVSNEFQEQSSELIPSSTYLRGIRLQEAKRLLQRYDYAGIQELLQEDLNRSNNLLAARIGHLLKAAILWNQAQFEEFGKLLGDEAQTRTEAWWWVGYESAYLAIVRFEQGNTVESLFHSFRAAEGMISDWAKQYYPNDIEDRGVAVAKYSTNCQLPAYLVEELVLKEDDSAQEMKLYGESLFKLFRETRPDSFRDEHVKVIWKGAKDKRNQHFHRLLGLDEKSVFQAWGMNSRPSWENRLCKCLDFIANQNFASLKEASLMAMVHQELLSVIAANVQNL